MKQTQISLLGDRPDNQDRCAIIGDQNSYLMIMADGLGGHPRGDVAAQSLLDTCKKYFSRCPKPIVSPRLFFHQCAIRTHERIRQFMQEQKLDDSPRTTAMMVLVQERQCYWSYTGDSRFYLFRQGRLLHRSVDHTLETQDTTLCGTTRGRTLTQCLGGISSQPIATSHAPIPLQADDILLLCSDGFWAQLPEARILLTLNQVDSLAEAIESLGQQARNNFAGYSDNISAVALKLEKDDFPDAQSQEDNWATAEESQDLLSALDQLDDLIQSKLHI